MSGREQFTNNGGIATRHGPVVFHLEHLDRGDHWSTVRKWTPDHWSLRPDMPKTIPANRVSIAN